MKKIVMKKIVAKRSQMANGKVVDLPQDAVLYVGVDMHKKSWSVTVLARGEVLKRTLCAPSAKSLLHILSRFEARKIMVAYEAGCFGYGLYDELSCRGMEVLVVPPSKVLKEPGERVKTDRKDSLMLAKQLSLGLLKSITVPDEDRRAHRQLLRTLDQVKKDKKRTMSQIKSFLCLHGIDSPFASTQRWSRRYLLWLKQVSLPTDDALGCLRTSFDALILAYEQRRDLEKELDAKVKNLLGLECYRDKAEAICKIKGVGPLTAIRLLLEVGHFGRFKNTRKFSSFLGLTPSENSSGERIRRGSITGCGNKALRSALVEVAWMWIRYNPSAKEDFKKLSYRRGANRAIVAMARKLAIQLYWLAREVELIVESVPAA